MHFLKVQKKGKIHPPKTGVQNCKKHSKSGAWEQRRKIPGRRKSRKSSAKSACIGCPKIEATGNQHFETEDDVKAIRNLKCTPVMNCKTGNEGKHVTPLF
jgi:hypothetical protein